VPPGPYLALLEVESGIGKFKRIGVIGVAY